MFRIQADEALISTYFDFAVYFFLPHSGGTLQSASELRLWAILQSVRTGCKTPDGPLFGYERMLRSCTLMSVSHARE